MNTKEQAQLERDAVAWANKHGLATFTVNKKIELFQSARDWVPLSPQAVVERDFWEKFKQAMEEAGGNGRALDYEDRPFREVVNILAPNGIRVVHNKDWSIENY